MLYIVCLVSVMILSYLADRFEKRIYLFLCAVLLSAFCGLRGVETGVDTLNYYNFLVYIRDIGIRFGSDIGFSCVSYFLMRLFDNPYYALLTFATVTNFFIVYRLWDFRHEASLSLMLLIYSVVYYPYTFNIVRQFLAISLVFWATQYIERGEYKKYIIANSIAATFHTSALMCFSYLFFTFGYRTKKKKYKFLDFGFATLIFAAGFYFLRTNVSKYENFFISSRVSIHMMTIFKIACWLFVVMINRVYKNVAFSITKTGDIIPMQRQIPTMYAIGLILWSIGMLFSFMNRIGFYYIMFELPFWGQAVRARVNRDIFKILILIILVYYLTSDFIIQGSPDNLFRYHSFLID